MNGSPLRFPGRARMTLPPIMVLAALILSACAAYGPVEPQQNQIPVETARRTFSVGYQQISERYIEYLPVSVLAFEGVRGLNALDPDFVATREGDRVSFGIVGHRRHTLAASRDTDADGWAALTVEAVRLAKLESVPISAASMGQVYEAVFDGSVSLLDTYSRYSGAEEAALNREKRSGYGGIGVVLKTTTRGAAVVQVSPDTPASKAGLRAGDLITHIDSHPVDPARSGDVSDAVRGPIGAAVVLRIERAGRDAFDVSVIRQRVTAQTVFVSEHNNIVTARITGFNRGTTRQLAARLNEALLHLGGAARGIVLDLRGNPGGLLSEAVHMADLFIAEGRILSTRGRHLASVHEYDAREDDVADGLPIVVIVNGRSASAAEIVAAALQDHDRGIVIGSDSYGKGMVQTIIPLPNDGELTVTWSRFVAPSGYGLNGLGVRPSVCTNAPDGTADQFIQRTLADGAELVHVFEAWRAIDTRPDIDRKSLKALCPASDREKTVDGTIAESLIADSGLYNRILAFAPTAVAVHKQP